MRSCLKSLLAGLALVLSMHSAQALVIDPFAGASGSGSFSGGVGAPVTFGGDTTLSFTSATGLYLDFTAVDCCITGDAFGLLIDGVLTAWTTETFPGGVGGNFIGFLDDYFLAAGAHTIGLFMTHDCCGSGGMDWSASAEVPEPGTLALIGIAVIGLASLRRRANV